MIGEQAYEWRRLTLQAEALRIVDEQRRKRIAIVETADRGIVRYYDATAEFEDPRRDELVLVSTERPEEILATFASWEWRRVTVQDGFKTILFSITKGGEAIRVVTLPNPQHWPAA